MKIDRLLAMIVYLLNRNLVSASRLAQEFDVSVRTIQRDMDTIQQAGIPVIAVQGPQGGYGIMEQFRMDRQLVTADDLFYITAALGSISTSLTDKKISATVEKMRNLVTDRDRKAMAVKQEKLYVDFSMLGGDPKHQEILRTAEQGVETNRLMRFSYTNNKLETVERTVEPMTIVFKWRAWYLWAYCRTRNDYRLFRFSRMRNPELLPGRFLRKNMSFESFLSDLEKTGTQKMTEFTLSFDPAMKALVEEYWGESGIDYRSDGRLVVKSRMPEDGWIYGMILSYGAFVTVLDPPELRERIRSEAERISRLYD